MHASVPLTASYDPAADPGQIWGAESPYAAYQKSSNGAPYVGYSPEVVLNSYSVTDNGLVAGWDVTMVFEFANTSRLAGVFDLVVQFGTTPDTMYPAYGQTNQSFITAIPPGGTAMVEKSFSIALTPKEIIEMPIRVRYQGVGTGQKETSTLIYLPVFSANSLSTQVNIESTVYTGSQVSLSGFCGNLSKRDIIDLEMTLEGDFSGSPMPILLGRLAPGEQLPISGSIVFPQENSAAAVSATFAFSDQDGNRIGMAAQNFRVMVINRPESAPVQAAGGLPLAYIAMAGGAMLAIVAFVVMIIRKRR